MNFDPRLIFIPALRVATQPPPRKLALQDVMSSRARLELESLSHEDVNKLCEESTRLLLETLAPFCPSAAEALAIVFTSSAEAESPLP